jgi:type IV secretory pathway TraG/TraD family ATPase VirD4
VLPSCLHTYGDAEAQTIVENCGSTLILRCSASEGGGTAEFASRLIGEREIMRP